MNLRDDRLPPELRALLADLEQPPAGDSRAQRIARGERAYEAVAACLGDSDPLLADIAECLWVEYSHTQDLQEIENQLRRMMQVLDRPDVAPSHKLGMAFKRLANLRMIEESWDEAIAAAKRGLEVFARAGVPDDVQAGKLRFLLSNAYLALRDHKAARDALLESLPALRSNEKGREELILALRGLAQHAMKENDPGDALSYFTDAMNHLPRAPERMPEYCDIGVKMARCMLDMQEFGECADFLEPVVPLLEGLSSIDVPLAPSLLPTALEILGTAQLGLEQHDKALDTFAQALQVSEKTHGAGSDEVARLHTMVHWTHQARGDHEAAEQAAARTVDIYERMDIDSSKDARYVDALWNLAKCHLTTKRFDEADAIARRMIELVEPTVGPDGPRMTQLLGLRGRILFARGDYEEALPVIEQALVQMEGTEIPKIQYVELSRMAVEIRLFHRPVDAEAGPALERAIGALKSVIKEVEDENDRLRYGLGHTPRSERS